MITGMLCCFDRILFKGHEILARKLDKHGIAYRKEDNTFTWIEDTRS